LLVEGIPLRALEAQLRDISYLSQSRVRLLDTNSQVIADSADPFSDREDAPFTVGIVNGSLTRTIYFFAEGQEDLQTNQAEFPEYGKDVPILPQITPYPIPTYLAGERLEVVVPRFDFPTERDDAWDVPGRELALPAVPVRQVEGSAAIAQVMDFEGNIVGWIELSETPSYKESIIGSVTVAWGVAGSLAVMLAAAVGWFVSRRFTEPLASLTDATTQMTTGDLSVRADVSLNDEFGHLADSFNAMAYRVEGQVDALRRFVADAAHGIHTPLTALRTNLELASNAAVLDRDEYLSHAHDQLSRLEVLSDNLLALSRLEVGDMSRQRQTVNLSDVVSAQAEVFASRAEQTGVNFSLTEEDTPMVIEGNQDELEIMVSNLMDNAVKFTQEGEEVRVDLRGEGDHLVLTVEDTGIGILPEDLPHLFSRFRRGRNASAFPGSGLGLAIIRAVAEGNCGGGKPAGRRSLRGEASFGWGLMLCNKYRYTSDFG
jgi:signal transduction histidine kinase